LLIFVTVTNLAPVFCYFFSAFTSRAMESLFELIHEIGDAIPHEQCVLVFRRPLLLSLGVGTVINIAIWVAYGAWLMPLVFAAAHMLPFAYRILLVVVFVTFLLRLSTPFVLQSAFLIVSRWMHVRALNYTERLRQATRDGSPLSVADAILLHREMLRVIRSHIQRWQFLFVGLVGVPFITFCLLIYHAVFDSGFLLSNWFFIVYPLHYVVLAFTMLLLAAQGSKQLRLIPENVIADLGTGTIVLQPSGACADMSAFIGYLRTANPNIEILRLPMTFMTVRMLIYVLITAMLAMLQQFFRSLSS
jgi:hypothetical protein